MKRESAVHASVCKTFNDSLYNSHSISQRLSARRAILWGVQRTQPSWASQSDGLQEKIIAQYPHTPIQKKKINMFRISISKKKNQVSCFYF